MEYKRILDIDEIEERLASGYSSHPEAVIATALMMLEEHFSQTVADFVSEKRFIADLKRAELPKDLSPADIATSLISTKSVKGKIIKNDLDEFNKIKATSESLGRSYLPDDDLFTIDNIGGKTESKDKAVKQKLLKNPEAVLKFIAEHKNYTLTVTKRADLFKGGAIAELSKLIKSEPYRFTQGDNAKEFTNYKPTNAKKFIDIILAQPTFTRFTLASPSTTSDGVIRQALYDTKALAEACGIEAYGSMMYKDLSFANFTILNYINLALFSQLERFIEKNNKKRGVVNIYNSEAHAYMIQNALVSLTDMIDGSFEGREFKNIFETYRKEGYGSNTEIKKAGGWLAHIDPVQTVLPLDLDESDRPTMIKFMVQCKALVIQTMTALQQYLRDHPEYDPEHNENDFIKLIDLARYIPRFNDSKLKKGELRAENRNKILLGLRVAQIVGTEYKVGVDKKTNKDKYKMIYLINRIENYKKYRDTDIITDVQVDFTKGYKESGALNIGVILDGVLSLEQSEKIALGSYLSERFAQYQDDTIKGNPQTITATTLIKKAGIVDSNISNKLVTLQNMLDSCVDEGIISKWVCKNGAKKMSNLDKKSQTILVYPTKNQMSSYAPKSRTQTERKAVKQEQKNRLRAFKKWFKGYTKRETASEVLGVSVAELDEMLAGTKPIDDDILDIIKEEL